MATVITLILQVLKNIGAVYTDKILKSEPISDVLICLQVLVSMFLKL